MTKSSITCFNLQKDFFKLNVFTYRIMYRSQGLPNFVIQNNPLLLWYIMFVFTIKCQFGDASDQYSAVLSFKFGTPGHHKVPGGEENSKNDPNIKW